MSLATRCTSCGTVFRVVQDQLKVSDGWVRCGRCDAVFHAATGVFDLERETPPPWSPTQPPSVPRDVSETGALGVLPDDEPSDLGDDRSRRRAIVVDDDPADDVAGRPPAPLGSVASRPLPAAAHDLFSAALARHTERADAGPTTRPEAPLGALAAAPAYGPPFDDDDAHAGEVAQVAPPGFVARARRDAFWHGPWVRSALSLSALLLAVGLVAQAAARFSDIAAARWPALQPALTRWCGVAGCSLAAPRRIDELVVDSSSLAPVIGSEALKLGLALRNRAGFAVAVPSVDLSLTDSAGQLIARRTLHPADFRVGTASIASSAELPLQAIITAGAARVTGYTVEIFYP